MLLDFQGFSSMLVFSFICFQWHACRGDGSAAVQDYGTIQDTERPALLPRLD